MKNLSISKKLILLTVFSILSLSVTWFLSNQELKNSEALLDTVQSEIIPSIQLLNDTNSATAAMRAAVRDYTIGGFLEDSSLQKAQMVKFEELKQKITTNLTTYESKYLTGNEDRKLLENDKEAFVAYLNEVTDLFSKIDARDTAGISQQYSEKGMFRITAMSLIDKFNQHALYNQQRADKLKVESNRQHAVGFILILAQYLLCLAIVGLISFLVIRGINQSLNALKTSIDKIERELDFTTTIVVNRQDEIGEVAESMIRLILKLKDSFREIIEGSKKSLEASQELSLASVQVATASSVQSDSAASMAASMEELTVSINQVAEKTKETFALSIQSESLSNKGHVAITRASTNSKEIADVVKRVADEISELDRNSDRITIVVSVIKEVADQTNLLALNAAIEAARAGDQGRGFAVVADEVKKLAERTSKSTEEIQSTIASIKQRTTAAASNMMEVNQIVQQSTLDADSALEAIQQIETVSVSIKRMTEEIDVSMSEQSQAADLLAQNIESIARASEENSASSTKTASLANGLKDLSTQLSQTVEEYRV